MLVPLWEAWSAAQKACINNKPQLKGSAKEIPHPLGKQREGAGTNTTPKPGGQGCSPAALARMCTEVGESVRRLLSLLTERERIDCGRDTEEPVDDRIPVLLV